MKKKRIGFVFILMVILGVAVLAQPGLAGPLQQGTTWSAAIAYFNPDPDASQNAELTVTYYPENTAGGLSPTRLNVNSHYSGTLLVGMLPGGQGSAVLSSNFQMPAVYKISASSGDPYGVNLLEFFTSEQAGVGKFYLPVVNHENAGLTSTIGIQNLENEDIIVSIRLVSDTGDLVDISMSDHLGLIEAQTSEVFTIADFPDAVDLQLGLPGFSGSMVIEAELASNGLPARIAAASADFDGQGRLVHTYQGSKGGSTAVNIPAAFCQYGKDNLSTNLNIQNVSGSVIPQDTMSVTAGGSTVNIVHPQLAAGEKRSFDVCTIASLQPDQITNLVIEAPEVISVVIETTNGEGFSATSTSSASTCVPDCGSGTDRFMLALPYVEWSASSMGFETTLYIMNTGVDPAVVYASFFRRDASGGEQTLNIPAGEMVETSPMQAPGVMNMQFREFKGAVLLDSNQPVMAFVLVTRQFRNPDGSTFVRGDSYMGMKYLPAPTTP